MEAAVRESVIGWTEERANKRWMLRSEIINGMIGNVHPEKIIELVCAMYDTMAEDYTIDEIHEHVYQQVEMHNKNGIRLDMVPPIATRVSDFVEFTSGAFTVMECLRELNITDPGEKAAVRKALARMASKDVLERVGTKDGVYRRIDTDVKRTKFITGRLEEFPMRLPLGINDLCKLYAKNIVVVAGSKSAGKTAFLMNIALDNQHDMPVVYLNSEMGDEEFTSRMQMFGITSEDQIKFDCIECHNNFADHIDGTKKLYIIDFLEIHDNFYEIAKHIRAIHEKLGDGVAVIAIQKKNGERLGRGADFSMEKARLYISMDYQQDAKCTRVTIVDAKSPKRQGVRGAYQDVKILSGTSFSSLSGIKNDWQLQE